MTVYDMLIEMMPFFLLPIAFDVLRFAYSKINCIVHGSYSRDLKEEITRQDEFERREEERTKINIDKDLQKYFNYKE